jgi:diguanylate cyclase (GGDEF)-like protein
MRRLHGLSPRFARHDPGRSGAAFGIRLAASFLFALILVGVAGYFFMDQQLRDSQVTRYAATQRSFALTFESYSNHAVSGTQAISRVDQVLDALGRQNGTLETLLIDNHGVVRASGNERAIRTRDMDVRIADALREGKAYSGREADPAKPSANFEFVTPLHFDGSRYALEVSYDHAVLDAQLSDVRRGLLLVGLLALVGGGGVFYLFGGRALLRSHRSALQRATRDGLTDLPNHRAFQDEFAQAVAAAERNRDPLALIALDLDDFKFINDRHGHPHGDAILRRAATLLREGRPGDRAYRIGGDEFVLLLPHTDAAGARILARRLLRDFGGAQVQVTVGASALQPGHGSDLRAEADAALYEAKRLGGNRAAHFDDLRGQIAVVGADKRAAVRRLLEEQRLTTVYQPIWNIADGTLVGSEALSRPAAEYGFSGPAEAFDIAEQVGREHDLDVICVKSALASAAGLPEGALLFVNLCPRTLDLDAAGNDWLSRSVTEAGLSPSRVVIELTERFGGRAPSIIQSLHRLRSQGFQIAIDDVGTGNSGLAMLRQVKVEFVKLDRSIVTAASTDPAARGVLMAISTFARQTGAFVIAEGIEDQETLEFLQALDDRAVQGEIVIQGGQGYGLGRPARAIDAALPPELRDLHEPRDLHDAA